MVFCSSGQLNHGYSAHSIESQVFAYFLFLPQYGRADCALVISVTTMHRVTVLPGGVNDFCVNALTKWF